jgi:hypothetical protein
MYWLLTSLFLTADPMWIEKIYVAPPTVHRPILTEYQPYINSLLVATVSSNTQRVKKSNRAQKTIVMDKHTVEATMDTTCDYNKPLYCANENQHWVMITDIFTTSDFATIVIKLYDENTDLIASISSPTYSLEKCPLQIKEKFCVTLEPKILARDIHQAVTIMFDSIPPE